MYLIIFLSTIGWQDYIEVIEWPKFISQPWHWLFNEMLDFANKNIFKVYNELIPRYGSGDTSEGWAQFWFFLLLSLIISLIWSVVDRKKSAYPRWNYGLITLLRYFLALIGISYGFVKIFTLQMPAPSLSFLATPLGEFSGMRLTWLFIGYSAPYQIFTGVAELLVGLLLINRKTATAGVIMAVFVFTNVVAMNLCYDIIVKIDSIHFLVMALFLLVQERKRIVGFFLMNKKTDPGTIYEFTFTQKWKRITRYVLKGLFIILVFYYPFKLSERFNRPLRQDQKPIRSGIYDVVDFVVNKDTIAIVDGGSTRWTNMIFHPGKSGSMVTSDTLFIEYYGRSYFEYVVDTAKQQINFMKRSDTLFTLRYTIPDSTTITMRGPVRGDTLYIRLKRNNKKYPLGEWQFNWLSEDVR